MIKPAQQGAEADSGPVGPLRLSFVLDESKDDEKIKNSSPLA
jgi:hypothetical protein